LLEADDDEGASGSASDCDSEGSDTSGSEDDGRLGARGAGSNGKALVSGASLTLGKLASTPSQLATLRARESTLVEKGK
jgi:hypothetical protein